MRYFVALTAVLLLAMPATAATVQATIHFSVGDHEGGVEVGPKEDPEDPSTSEPGTACASVNPYAMTASVNTKCVTRRIPDSIA